MRSVFGLKDIISLNPEPPLYTDYAFGVFMYDISSQATLYVPKGSVEAYRAAEGWKKFHKIKPVDTSDNPRRLLRQGRSADVQLLL